MPLLQAITRFKQRFIEQRRSRREPVYFPAWIESTLGSQRHECSVLDVSDGGARILVPARTRISKEFWLLLSKDGARRRRCQIAWRSDDQIGVSYLGPPEGEELKAVLH